MLIKTKKALLLGEHVFNIIVAVLCILVLVGLGVAIYNMLAGSNENAKAKAELESLIGAIENLQAAGGGNINHIVFGPEGWAIVGWPLDDGSIPDYCSSNNWDNCLCFCDLDFSGIGRANWLKLTKESVLNACNVKNICAKMNVKDFQVNPLDNLISYFLGINSKHRPIVMDQLQKAYVGNLEISYDKTNDKLVIMPK